MNTTGRFYPLGQVEPFPQPFPLTRPKLGKGRAKVGRHTQVVMAKFGNDHLDAHWRIPPHNPLIFLVVLTVFKPVLPT
jgi:hypothetical protein